MAHVSRGHGIAAIIFGVFEVLFGILLIICGFVAASKVSSAIMAPYWIGFVYLVPGILGIAAGAAKNNGCMIAFMILNIILFILLGIGSILLFIGVSILATVFADLNTYCVSGYDTCTCNYEGRSFQFTTGCNAITSLMPVLWAIAIFCLISGLVTLASSILGCVSSCCSSPPAAGGLVVQEQVPHGYPPVYIQQQQSAGTYAPPQYADSKSGPI